jgi:serine/threonine protein kinase
VAQPSSALSQVRIIGRYALYDEIASGGMATVHIGRLLGPVGFSRTVAIKRLHPHFAKENDFVSMFLDEARLAARIRHPNVVGTLDVVALDGELFLVMEYVQGESLARLLRPLRERGEGVPVPIATAIIVGVLEGLHAAHEATSDQGDPLGIVHRDVSPQNVLVGTDGVARVVDFGVAKAAGRVQTTRDGQVKGKLGYMAPEQITGNATRATDVHAASVVLWEMLTARRLYHGDNDLQTYANILAGNVLAPSKFAPEVSPALDRVVMRGLAANPLTRFATAREMSRAIQQTTPIASAYDVGDWVESIGGANIGLRARKVVAIESSGTLPSASSSSVSSAPSTPEPLDISRSSHPPSQSPVSGERRRVPRQNLALVVPIVIASLLATIVAVVAVGVVLRGARPWAFGRHASAPASATLPQAPSAASPSPAARPPSAWTVARAASPEPESAAPPVAPSTAGVDPSQKLRPPPWPAPVSGAPFIATAPLAATPKPQPLPAAGGHDFAHVMDSRK